MELTPISSPHIVCGPRAGPRNSNQCVPPVESGACFRLEGEARKIACRAPEARPLAVLLIATQLFLCICRLLHLSISAHRLQCAVINTQTRSCQHAFRLLLQAHAVPDNSGPSYKVKSRFIQQTHQLGSPYSKSGTTNLPSFGYMPWQ